MWQAILVNDPYATLSTACCHMSASHQPHASHMRAARRPTFPEEPRRSMVFWPLLKLSRSIDLYQDLIPPCTKGTPARTKGTVTVQFLGFIVVEMVQYIRLYSCMIWKKRIRRCTRPQLSFRSDAAGKAFGFETGCVSKHRPRTRGHGATITPLTF